MFTNNIPRQHKARLLSGGTIRSRREPAAKKAAGRSLHEFQPLLPGETHLLQACQQGRMAKLGDQVPDTPGDERKVRAPFLRFLLLGGDEQAPVHERGTQLQGAVIDGTLDLGGCLIPHNIHLHHCLFTHLFVAQDARVQGLVTLEGSHLLGGINAERIQCDGGLYLRNGFKATGVVRLLGAQIGGDLACSGGQFEVNGGNALSADGSVVKGTVFLCEGFKATGVVRLLSTEIGGNLQCNGGQFEVNGGDALSADGSVIKGTVFLCEGFKATGVVRLLGTQIGSDLACSGGQFEVKEGDALSADGSVIKGSVFLCDGFKAIGKVGLPSAQIGGNLDCRDGQFEVKEGNALNLQKTVVGGAWLFRTLKSPLRVNASHMQLDVLVDEIRFWGAGSVLNGLRYNALGGDAPIQAKDRLAWLNKQSPEHLGTSAQPNTFRPQPWRQLQRVLRDMGHAEDARQIGMAFEQQLRKADLIGSSTPETWKLVAFTKRITLRATHGLFGGLSGYGYRPVRLVVWMAAVWLICGIGYWCLALPPHKSVGFPE
jgi:sRNA-binding regulator protein Hfq